MTMPITYRGPSSWFLPRPQEPPPTKKGRQGDENAGRGQLEGPLIMMNKAHYPVTALGPGRRAGIWVQGCTIGCTDCVSLDTWPADPRTAVEVATVLGWLASLPERPDGVTISGGEPFQQPIALRELLRGIQEWRRDCAIDILVYSGYSMARLRRSEQMRELLELCDAVIAGPYVERLNTGTTRWRGSTNQRIVPLTRLGDERYGGVAMRDEEHDTVQMQVSVVEGDVYSIGIPRRGDMNRLTESLREAGVHSGAVSWRA